MSHQPSTLDNFRSTAASATHAVAATLDPKDETNIAQKTTKSMHTDEQGTVIEKGSFKDQLNEAAIGAYKPTKEETLLEKAAAYVPGLSVIIGNEKVEGVKEREVIENGEPPQRPEHDVQVGEFIKEQYKSKSGNAMPEVGDKK